MKKGERGRIPNWAKKRVKEEVEKYGLALAFHYFIYDCDTTDLKDWEIQLWRAFDRYIFQLSQSHADDNINILAGWSWDCGWESEEDRENYYNHVNYHWKEIAEKEYKNWLRKQQLS